MFPGIASAAVWVPAATPAYLSLIKLDFSVRQDDDYIYIQDARKYAIRGLFVLAKQSSSDLLITVPHPSTERIATDSAALLMEHLNSDALVLGTQATPSFSANNMSQQSNYYGAFIQALHTDEILQVLNQLKDEIEEHNLRQEEDRGLEWNDLD